MYGQYKKLTGSLRGRPDGQGPDLGRQPGPHRGDRLRPGLLHGRDAPGGRQVPGRSDRRDLRLGQRRHLRRRKRSTSWAARSWRSATPTAISTIPTGIKLETVKRLKEVERSRISEYVKYASDGASITRAASGIWGIKCDIALPCATQNEIDEAAAKLLVKNGCYAVGEGANMPSTPEAIKVFLQNKVLFGPAKAANAGGVATSALEMSQNSMRYSWTFEEVDAKLKQIMVNIYRNASSAAKEYGIPGNLVAGANIAGFLKVANAMMAQGIV